MKALVALLHILALVHTSFCLDVYLYPCSWTSELSGSLLTPSQARVLLAHHLGLDMFESLEGAGSKVAEAISHGTNLLGETYSGRKMFLLTMSEDVVKDVIPPSSTPVFTLPNPPSPSEEVSRIVSSFLHRAKFAYSTTLSSKEASSQPVPSLIDIFAAHPSSSTELFLSQTASLVSLLESDEKDAFGAFELTGLTDLALQYGRQSELYQLAIETTRGLLASMESPSPANSDTKSAFALITYPTSVHRRRQLAPQPPEQSPLPPPISPAPHLPISGVSTCFASADTCSNATDTCSGRGQCRQASKAGRTCFVCACDVTRDAKGRREWWVGEKCERKDVSGPFVLLAGTVVGLVLLIIGSISVLYSIGNEVLPPTLTSGAAGGVMKRE